eukprot:2998736-Alexandrium_andersonii.AAC.1
MAARCPGRSVGWSLSKRCAHRLPTDQTARTTAAPAVLPTMTEKTVSNALSGRPFLHHGPNWNASRGPSQ